MASANHRVSSTKRNRKSGNSKVHKRLPSRGHTCHRNQLEARTAHPKSVANCDKSPQEPNKPSKLLPLSLSGTRGAHFHKSAIIGLGTATTRRHDCSERRVNTGEMREGHLSNSSIFVSGRDLSHPLAKSLRPALVGAGVPFGQCFITSLVSSHRASLPLWRTETDRARKNVRINPTARLPAAMPTPRKFSLVAQTTQSKQQHNHENSDNKLWAGRGGADEQVLL